MRDFKEFHDSRFDTDVQFAYDFVKDLGSQADPTPPHKMTVVAAERFDEFRDFYNTEFLKDFPDRARANYKLPEDQHGRYHPPHPLYGKNEHSLFVIDESSDDRLVSSLLSRRSALIHESVHSVTHTGNRFHRLYGEILAGLGEVAFIEHVDSAGWRQPPLNAIVGIGFVNDRLTRMVIPGTIRTTDKREDTYKGYGGVNASPGAVAAYALLQAAKKLDIALDPSAIIGVSRPERVQGVALIRKCLRKVDPDLPILIESCIPQCSDGYLDVAHFILQTVAKMPASKAS